MEFNGMGEAESQRAAQPMKAKSRKFNGYTEDTRPFHCALAEFSGLYSSQIVRNVNRFPHSSFFFFCGNRQTARAQCDGDHMKVAPCWTEMNSPVDLVLLWCGTAYSTRHPLSLPTRCGVGQDSRDDLWGKGFFYHGTVLAGYETRQR